MKFTIKRCLLLGISLSLAALTALRCRLEREIEGSLAPPRQDKPGPQPPREGNSHAAPALPHTSTGSATTVTFSGTVVRKGSRLALRETAGVLYPLECTPRAWSFEGEDVRVTGKIDPSTSLLHVDAIEPVTL